MKSIYTYKNGIRTVYDRKGCHSCWDCEHFSEPSKSCKVKNIDSNIRRNFPYDNTICKEYKEKEQ